MADLEPFEDLYAREKAYAIRAYGVIRPALKPLLGSPYEDAARRPVDPAALKRSLMALFSYLAGPEGRTDAHCRLVDRFIWFYVYGTQDRPQLPEGVDQLLFDAGAQLHDTFGAPEIAVSFQSTPEQLLERARALPY